MAIVFSNIKSSIQGEDTMIFVVHTVGDTEVGIQPDYNNVTLPNPGMPEEDWIEQCKDALKELYDNGTRCYVYTKQEYDMIILAAEGEFKDDEDQLSPT